MVMWMWMFLCWQCVSICSGDRCDRCDRCDRDGIGYHSGEG